MEAWKSIKGFDGEYEISNIGNVKSLKSNLIMKLSGTRNKYFNVPLSKNNKSKNYMVHRLVAEAFIPNPENKPVVNHKDGNKRNNAVDNLEWATISENNQHAFDTGLNPFTDKMQAAVNENVKLASAARKRIVVNKENGIFYDSLEEAAKAANLKRGTLLKRMRKHKHKTSFEYA